MFCINCGKEVNDDIFTGKCPYCGSNQKIEDNSGKIKDFILSWGRILCDIDTCLWITIAIIVTIVLWASVLGCLLPNKNGYFDLVGASPLALTLSIVLPIIFLIFIVISKYLIYLLIDIKDGINKLIEQNEDKKDA